MGLRAISVRTLGVRAVAVTAALVVGVSGLTACRTNVGNAATIDGHRVSESDVNDFVTSAAKPIKSSDGSQSISPKPFVIDILIQQRLYRKLLVAAPSGAPSKGQLSTLRRQYLAGKSAKATVERLGAVGYTTDFDAMIVDVQVMGSLLNQQQQRGVDVSAIVRKTTFPVKVNPRYGTWDTKTLRFDAGTASGLPTYLKLQSAAALVAVGGRTVTLPVPAPSSESPLQRVVEVMDRLRSPGGCPWDAEQTHASLARYLVEECYEVLEAIETEDATLLREELGDLLLQVLFHARIAEETAGGFAIGDVAADLADKLVRRHPHVFAGAAAGTADELNETWERQKVTEKGRTSAVDGVPVAQPALALAAKLVTRARRHGVDAPVPTGEGVGPRLFALVQEAVAAGLDPETELRRTARAYRQSVIETETR